MISRTRMLSIAIMGALGSCTPDPLFTTSEVCGAVNRESECGAQGCFEVRCGGTADMGCDDPSNGRTTMASEGGLERVRGICHRQRGATWEDSLGCPDTDGVETRFVDCIDAL